MNKNGKEQLLRGIPSWFHSIDCGDGVVTAGVKKPAQLEAELNGMALPDLRGKTVLDIGAWDGYFSFKAEELGAERVLALDHWAWAWDRSRGVTGKGRWLKNNKKIADPRLIPAAYNFATLPGKAGFDTIHRIKQSTVEQLLADFMAIDIAEIGMFDVVFFLGVLYHLQDPLRALRRLSRLTRELAVIETHAVFIEDHEGLPLFQFYGSDELNKDPTNWFGPNLAALRDACMTAGFRRATVTSGYPPRQDTDIPKQKVVNYRLIVHAYK